MGPRRRARRRAPNRPLPHRRPRIPRRAAVPRGHAVRPQVQPEWPTPARRRRPRRPLRPRDRLGPRDDRTRDHRRRPIRFRPRGRPQRRPAVDRPRRARPRPQNLPHERRRTRTPPQEAHRVGHRRGILPRQQVSRDRRPQRRPCALGGRDRAGDVHSAGTQGRHHRPHLARRLRPVRLRERGRHREIMAGRRRLAAPQPQRPPRRRPRRAFPPRRPPRHLRPGQQGSGLGHHREKSRHPALHRRVAQSRDVQRRRPEGHRQRLARASFCLGREERPSARRTGGQSAHARGTHAPGCAARRHPAGRRGQKCRGPRRGRSRRHRRSDPPRPGRQKPRQGEGPSRRRRRRGHPAPQSGGYRRAESAQGRLRAGQTRRPKSRGRQEPQ